MLKRLAIFAVTLAIVCGGNYACRAQQQTEDNNCSGGLGTPQSHSEEKFTEAQNTNSEKHQDCKCVATETSNTDEQAPQRWRKREWAAWAANLALAIFGLFGILVGIGSLIVVWRQGSHIITSERAWLIAKIEKPVIVPDGPWAYAGTPKLTNKGRTPAFVYEIGNAAVFLPNGESLPEKPSGFEEKSVLHYEGRGIPVAPSGEVGRAIISPVYNAHQILTEQIVLWVYGYAKYRDVFSNQEHETRYCFRLIPSAILGMDDHNFWIDGPPAYNQAT